MGKFSKDNLKQLSEESLRELQQVESKTADKWAKPANISGVIAILFVIPVLTLGFTNPEGTVELRAWLVIIQFAFLILFFALSVIEMLHRRRSVRILDTLVNRLEEEYIEKLKEAIKEANEVETVAKRVKKNASKNTK